MGGKARTSLYATCVCCNDKICAVDSTLPMLTLRRIGLCQHCFDEDCWCLRLEDLSDKLAATKVDYDARINDVQQKYDKLEAALKRARPHRTVGLRT